MSKGQLTAYPASDQTVVGLLCFVGSVSDDVEIPLHGIKFHPYLHYLCLSADEYGVRHETSAFNPVKGVHRYRVRDLANIS